MTALGWFLLILGSLLGGVVLTAMLLFRDPIEDDPEDQIHGDVPHMGDRT